ncbi:hypothetical protein GKQ77_10050 [Streptomyces sp. BG9H]|uniref:Uncharacterized protein n=1 Tax=Streptomyces anatolicus TaxID=2675858 RepID=A0ABS6YKF7_9ACTN|nr:hypothetical protein [Streptomyces anatolicus]MBW5421906.1 hypothetical protein [Streptomyces anatolicus]
MYTHRRLTCATPKPAARLDGKQTVVVIVVLVLGVAMALTGMPVIVVAEVLTACGLIGAHVARRAPSAPAGL